MMDTSSRIQCMQAQLEQALTPSHLRIIDESAKHIGHAGALTGAGHFAIEIASAQFADKSLLACHRLIYAALTDLIGPEIHALRIVIV